MVLRQRMRTNLIFMYTATACLSIVLLVLLVAPISDPIPADLALGSNLASPARIATPRKSKYDKEGTHEKDTIIFWLTKNHPTSLPPKNQNLTQLDAYDEDSYYDSEEDIQDEQQEDEDIPFFGAVEMDEYGWLEGVCSEDSCYYWAQCAEETVIPNLVPLLENVTEMTQIDVEGLFPEEAADAEAQEQEEEEEQTYDQQEYSEEGEGAAAVVLFGDQNDDNDDDGKISTTTEEENDPITADDGLTAEEKEDDDGDGLLRRRRDGALSNSLASRVDSRGDSTTENQAAAFDEDDDIDQFAETMNAPDSGYSYGALGANEPTLGPRHHMCLCRDGFTGARCEYNELLPKFMKVAKVTRFATFMPEPNSDFFQLRTQFINGVNIARLFRGMGIVLQRNHWDIAFDTNYMTQVVSPLVPILFVKDLTLLVDASPVAMFDLAGFDFESAIERYYKKANVRHRKFAHNAPPSLDLTLGDEIWEIYLELYHQQPVSARRQWMLFPLTNLTCENSPIRACPMQQMECNTWTSCRTAAKSLHLSRFLQDKTKEVVAFLKKEKNAFFCVHADMDFCHRLEDELDRTECYDLFLNASLSMLQNHTLQNPRKLKIKWTPPTYVLTGDYEVDMVTQQRYKAKEIPLGPGKISTRLIFKSDILNGTTPTKPPQLTPPTTSPLTPTSHRRRRSVDEGEGTTTDPLTTAAAATPPQAGASPADPTAVPDVNRIDYDYLEIHLPPGHPGEVHRGIKGNRPYEVEYLSPYFPFSKRSLHPEYFWQGVNLEVCRQGLVYIGEYEADFTKHTRLFRDIGPTHDMGLWFPEEIKAKFEGRPRRAWPTEPVPLGVTDPLASTVTSAQQESSPTLPVTTPT